MISGIAQGMKTTLAAISTFTALCVLPVAAATPNEKRLSMEQRIQDTDTAVALKHYEAVRTELLNARMKLELAETEQAGSLVEREYGRKILALRIEILERYTKDLRDGLLKSGQFAAASGGRD